MADEELNDSNQNANTPPSGEFEWLRSKDGVVEVYGDYIHLNWTSLNVRIRVTQLIADPRVNPSSAKWVVEERAVCTLPWFTAKILQNLLTGLVTKYEQINGEIKLPQMPQM